jgi:hypothetical protein
MAPLAIEPAPGEANEHSSHIKSDHPVAELEKPQVLVRHREDNLQRAAKPEVPGGRYDPVDIEAAGRLDDLAKAPLAGYGEAFLCGHADHGS